MTTQVVTSILGWYLLIIGLYSIVSSIIKNEIQKDRVALLGIGIVTMCFGIIFVFYNNLLYDIVKLYLSSQANLIKVRPQ